MHEIFTEATAAAQADLLRMEQDELNEHHAQLYKAKLADVLKYGRCRLGLSQGMLAKRLGVTQAYISRLERGRQLPSHEMLIRIAQAFKARLLAPTLDFDIWNPDTTLEMQRAQEEWES